MDNLTNIQRTRAMKAVRSTNTSAEMRVRRLVFSLGYRYRIHAKKLPGCPDLLFASRRKVIFVHGCFWHCHDCPKGMKRPTTNVPYWSHKLSRNKKRDQTNQTLLAKSGWRTLVIWECELSSTDRVRRRIARFLGALPLLARRGGAKRRGGGSRESV